jgi:hypothetical protein
VALRLKRGMRRARRATMVLTYGGDAAHDPATVRRDLRLR